MVISHSTFSFHEMLDMTTSCHSSTESLPFFSSCWSGSWTFSSVLSIYLKLQHYSEIANPACLSPPLPQNSLRTGTVSDSILYPLNQAWGRRPMNCYKYGWWADWSPGFKGVTSFRETVMFIYLTLISPLFSIPSIGQHTRLNKWITKVRKETALFSLFFNLELWPSSLITY